MSFEFPGDGKLCDHCNCPGTPYEYRGIAFNGLHANRGERLCSRCLDRSVQADLDAPIGWAQCPARDYITPRYGGRGLRSPKGKRSA